MSSLGDIIASKREESDVENDSFDDDGFGSESESAPKIPARPQQPDRASSSTSTSTADPIPQVPTRPKRPSKSSVASTDSIPQVPKRPTSSSTKEEPIERSQSPIIPPRPKKQSTNSSINPTDETEEKKETVTESLKHTIEKIPVVGGFLNDDKQSTNDENEIEDKDQSPVPVIPKRPQRKQTTEADEEKSKKDVDEAPVIPSRPTKSSQSSEVESTEQPDNSVDTKDTPIIPIHPAGKDVSAKDDASEKVEVEGQNKPLIPERPTKSKAVGESEKDLDADEIKKNIEDTVKEEAETTEASKIPELKGTDLIEVEPKDLEKDVTTEESPVELEKDLFDAEPEHSSIDKLKGISTESEALDFANEPRSSVSSANSKDISSEAQAIDKIEESTSDLSKIQKLLSDDSISSSSREQSPTLGGGAAPIIPKRPARPSKLRSQVEDSSSSVEEKAENEVDNISTKLADTKLDEEKFKTESENESKSSPIIPSRPVKKSSGPSQESISKSINSGESSESSKPQSKTTGKAPPPVPKKPSSKIAAFQEMLRKNQEQERSQREGGPSGANDRSVSPPKRPSTVNRTESSESTDRSKFKQNLNGLFALPGMTRPGAAIPKNLQEQESENTKEDEEKDEEPKEIKSDARRSRAKGPRGKRTAKVEKVEIPDHRVIKVVDIWSSGLKSSGIHYDNKSELDTEESVIDADVKDEEAVAVPVAGGEDDIDLDDETDKDYINVSKPKPLEVEEALNKESTDSIDTKDIESEAETKPSIISTESETIKPTELEVSNDITKEDEGYESDNNDTAEEQSLQSLKPLKSRPELENDASIKSLKSEDVGSIATTEDVPITAKLTNEPSFDKGDDIDEFSFDASDVKEVTENKEEGKENDEFVDAHE